jgi:hypothetical protein
MRGSWITRHCCIRLKAASRRTGSTRHTAMRHPGEVLLYGGAVERVENVDGAGAGAEGVVVVREDGAGG